MDQFSKMRPVEATRTPAGYIGGKRNLSRRIVALIESTPHDAYAEAFVGMGGVFLKRRSAPAVEVINDYSGDVATLFRVLQRHYTAFMDMLRYQVASRREFERLKASDPATLTDLERAARFLYLQRLAFGGKVAGRNFGVTVTGGARFNVLKLAPLLEEVHERLAGVVTCLGRSSSGGTIGRVRCSTSIRPTGVARATMAPGCSAASSTPSWRVASQP